MLLPNSKWADPELIKSIQNATDMEIKQNAQQLLIWLQDINWPIASIISVKLCNLIDLLEDEILEILKGTDNEWKMSLLISLIARSNKPIPSKIYKYIVDQIEVPENSDPQVIEYCYKILSKK